MKNLLELISYIFLSIDRIDISVPRQFKDKLYQIFGSYNKKIYTKRYKNYVYHGFEIDKCRVIFSYPLKPKHQDPSRNKCYIRLLQPTAECQKTMKDIFRFIIGKKCDRNGVILKQIEVAYDFYTQDDKDYEKIEKLLDHHCVLKYGKQKSYKRFLQTRYMGSDGNVHKGTIGVRRYRKAILGNDYYRFEFQFNRRYLNDKNITFQLFPVDPQSFDALRHIELLDNFSTNGIKNMSRTILRKEGWNDVKSKNFLKRLEEIKAHLKRLIVGGTNGPKKTIPKQLEELKSLAKEKELSPNYRKYFAPMKTTIQRINFLSYVGKIEINVSKRICFCQT